MFERVVLIKLVPRERLDSILTCAGIMGDLNSLSAGFVFMEDEKFDFSFSDVR